MVTRKDFTTLADMFGYIILTINTNPKNIAGTVDIDRDILDGFMKKLNENYNPEKFWGAVRKAITEQLIDHEQ